jgi:hypothetical protein
MSGINPRSFEPRAHAIKLNIQPQSEVDKSVRRTEKAQTLNPLVSLQFKQSKTNYFLAYRRRKEAWDAAIEAGLPQPIVQELAQEAWFAGDPPVYRTPQELR